MDSTDGTTTKPPAPDIVPRSYQVELLEKALEKNVILCLGTGSGKTFISVMLMQELLYQTRASIHDGGKRCVFLAPNVELAKQQSVCVKRFLDAKVGLFFGDEVQLWDGATWAAEFASNQVLVMTPQVFCNILHANWVKLRDVNLLVLDECHRATGKNPYVQIMQNHYRDLQPSEKPKILGLTASVLNGMVKPADVGKKVLEVCQRLDCSLATSLDAITFSTKPSEVVVCYRSMGHIEVGYFASADSSSESRRALQTQLRRLLSDIGPFGTLKAIQHRINLTDHLIDSAMAEPAVIADYVSLRETLRAAAQSVEDWSSDVRKGRTVNPYPVQVPADLRNILVQPEDYSFPPKVHRLLETLRAHACRNVPLRCVIFATERYTVFGLWCVLTMLSRRCPDRYGFIKPGYIMGQNSMSQFTTALKCIMNFNDGRPTDEDDTDALEEFRSGTVNVLVATSVIEEGVDIPQCNFIVRFDKPADVRSYVQSRGRARARPSIYAIMCPNEDFAEVIAHLNALKTAELNVLNYSLRDDIAVDSADVEFILQDDPDLPTMLAFPERPRDSARITAQSARSTLQWYCDTLSRDRFKILRPTFKYSDAGPRDELGRPVQTCSVQFPRESKLYGECVTGRPMPTRMKAKISAALAACRRLFEVGELTENLVPKRRPPPDVYEWTNDEVAVEVRDLFEGRTVTQKSTISCSRARAAQLRTRRVPDLPAVGTLFVFRLRLEEAAVDEHYHGKIFRSEEEPTCFGVLTFASEPVQCVPDFPIFTKAGREVVHVDEVRGVRVDEGEWRICASFHAYLVERVLNVPGVQTAPQLAPVFVAVSGDELDFSLMSLAAGDSTEDRRPPTLSSVVSFTDQTFEKPRLCSCYVGELFDLDGELFVSMISIPKNIDFIKNRFVAATSKRDSTALEIKKRFAKPASCCQVEHLSAPQWAKALCLPSCFHRLNRLLVANSLREQFARQGIGALRQPHTTMTFDRVAVNEAENARRRRRIRLDNLNFLVDLPSASAGPTAVDIYTALSPLSTDDIVDSERYEVIGDSFLKLVVTLDLFKRFESEDEGYLTRQRCRLISNINLLTLAVRFGIQDAVESVKFCARSSFWPPGCLEPAEDPAEGGGKRRLLEQSYKSKICADSVEALIGVYLERSGANAALTFLSCLGLQLDTRPGSDFKSRLDLCTEPTVSSASAANLVKHEDRLRHIESVLGYRFSDRSLLLEAIIHQSYRFGQGCRSYERLEFLGDAVVDYLVSRYLYGNCPELSPGDLTNARSALVCNATFARAIAQLGLHKHLLHHSPVLHRLTEAYLVALERGTLDETLICEGETDDVTSVDVPKPLGDLLESLMGAIFLDSHMDFDRVWLAFRKLVTDDILTKYLIEIPRNPLAVLMEKFPNKVTFDEIQILENKQVRLEMEVAGERFVVVARNKKVARIALAKKALRHFDRLERRARSTLSQRERIANELNL